MPYSFTLDRGLLLLFLFYTGLLPFVPLGESLLQFYLPRIINRCGCKACESVHVESLCFRCMCQYTGRKMFFWRYHYFFFLVTVTVGHSSDLTFGVKQMCDRCVCSIFLRLCVLKDVHPWEAHPEEQAGRLFVRKVSKVSRRTTEGFLTACRM